MVDPAKLGSLPTVTSGGLALGTLLLLPPGDRVDRKRLVLEKLAATIASLALAAFAPNLALLLVAGFGTGQQLVPFASSIAPVDFLMPRDAEFVKNWPPLVQDFAVRPTAPTWPCASTRWLRSTRLEEALPAGLHLVLDLALLPIGAGV